MYVEACFLAGDHTEQIILYMESENLYWKPPTSLMQIPGKSKVIYNNNS
jgi:hypothetical protein